MRRVIVLVSKKHQAAQTRLVFFSSSLSGQTVNRARFVLSRLRFSAFDPALSTRNKAPVARRNKKETESEQARNTKALEDSTSFVFVFASFDLLNNLVSPRVVCFFSQLTPTHAPENRNAALCLYSGDRRESGQVRHPGHRQEKVRSVVKRREREKAERFCFLLLFLFLQQLTLVPFLLLLSTKKNKTGTWALRT